MRKKQRPTVNWDSVPVSLDTTYAARILGTSRSTIYNYINIGILPAKQYVKGGQIFIAKETLMTFAGCAKT